MTIFSKIIQNPEMAKEQVLEINDNFLIMLSLHPVTKGHALVIPKSESDNLAALENQGLLFETTIKWADLIIQKLGAKAYTLKINNRLYTLEDKGHVNHLHFHIIPRYSAEDKINIEIPIQAGKEDLVKVRDLIIH